MRFWGTIVAPVLLCIGMTGHTFAADDDQALIEQGKYVAKAADCGACHTLPDHGKAFAGGYKIDSPMGAIIATNITPSKTHGIGKWSEAEFTRAVREGVSPEGHLYPAMPYTAYGQISDQDMHALWVYFSKGIAPVDESPADKTNLSFPFNMRALMIGWNLLFARNEPAKAPMVEAGSPGRGEYLANALAHCSTCHTPRNMMMGEKSSVALSGAPLGGWYAPNITSDPNSGIGQWSEDEIVSYLKSGRAVGKAQAAGPMAEAVEHSFRSLTDDDLHALARYIMTVPPVATPGVEHAAFNSTVAALAQEVNLERDISHYPQDMSNGSSVDGERLYMGACSTCHQTSGKGTGDQFYPSLTSNTAVGSVLPANLIMAIEEGIHRKTNDYTVSMPAFKDQFTDAQTAAVATYVMQRFGGSQSSVTEDQVTLYKSGGDKPFIVRYMNWMMALGVLLAAAIVCVAAYTFRRR